MHASDQSSGLEVSEKKDLGMDCGADVDENTKTEVLEDNGEVFNQAEFRALGWVKAGIILMKLCFATGVLTIPSAFNVVGYGPGIILLVAWGSLTTYYAYVMYVFRMKHPGVHNIADAAAVIGGSILREIAGILFLLTWVLSSGSGFIGLAQGFKILANGKVCTVVWTMVAALLTAVVASIPTLGKLAILTWIGFASIFTAVFVVVVGVSQVDRPAAAPQTGPYDLGVISVGNLAFVPGLTAAINLFAGYASTPTFMPVVAEMRVPSAFPKALFSSQAFLMACYVSFGMVVYYYCGQYVASPSLARAGGTVEKIAYGISIPGFIMTSTLWVHLAAKFLLVRILRNSTHLQSNTVIHWSTWLGSTLGISAIAFITAEAIPFFSYLIGLIASFCCAPTCFIFPALMALYMDKGNHTSSKVKMALFALHIFTALLGAFITVAGSYTSIQSIINAYNDGILRRFSATHSTPQPRHGRLQTAMQLGTNANGFPGKKTPVDAGVRKILQAKTKGELRDAFATSIEIPRSPIQYLEQCLAELQRTHALLSNGGSPGLDTLNSSDPAHDKVIELTAVAITNRTTSSLIKSHTTLQHGAKLFYPSERPPLKIPVHGIYHDIYPRTAGREYAAQFSRFNARKIPLDVAKRLFDNYKDNILPRFPCFMESTLLQYFDHFYGESTDLPSTTIFVVTLILAISSLTSKRHDFRKVAALSEALHADAMRHVDFLSHSSIESLQGLLFLIQTALLLPHTVNLWYVSGEAMRMAIALGLHQEPDISLVPDRAHAELRRRLFWVTYQLERIVAISCGCPVAISDDHITTQLPFKGGCPHKNLGSFLEHMPPVHEEKQFLIHTQMCLIQSEIHGVQFFDQPIPDEEVNHTAWVQKSKESVHTLLRYASSEGIVTPWLISAAQQCQILLHRPCSRDIAVSEASLIEAATASIHLVNTLLKSSLAGGFVFTFELANSAFQGGMILLYALRNHTAQVQQATLADDSNLALENLSRYITELVETNLRNPIGNLGSEYDMIVLEELDFLVTQRRVHSIYHRNLPVPSKQSADAQFESLNQISPGFLDDDSWWRDFINDDFDMFDHYEPSTSTGSFTVPALENPPDQKSPKIQRQPVKRGTDLDEVLEALPACSFCRDRRIKCHRQLPACRECQRTGRECTFFDPILSENISLKRVHFLAKKIKELAARNAASPIAHFSASSEINHSQRIVLLPFETSKDRPVEQESIGQFPYAKTAFYGPWSLPGCLRALLKTTPDWDIPPSLREANKSSNRISLGLSAAHADLPSPSVTQSLIQLFCQSVNTFFPILDKTSLTELASRSYDENANNAAEIFYLTRGIACLVAKRSEPMLASWGRSFFETAISHFDTTCDHSSRSINVKLLQRTLLICVYLLLDPEAGDIWRHLGFAIHLFLDLSHRPSDDEDEDHQLFCTLTRTLYCLESQISIAYSRPSLLIIGDNLRDELTQRTSNSLEENISIFFYLISFHKMKIHSALLKQDPDITVHSQLQTDEFSCETLRQDLDEWFVRWKVLVTSLSENQDKRGLVSWGELNYYQGLFMMSILWPRTAISLCGNITKACTDMSRQQQLFAHLNSEETPLIFPMKLDHRAYGGSSRAASNERRKEGSWSETPRCWNTERVIFDPIHRCHDFSYSSTRGTVSIGRCLVLLSSLEADPANLLTGQTMVLEELCKAEDVRQ
ncbi:neutral amino acid permease [Fusarium albosuccineum]|uniref:Neutral amino acid permease n=1 Tax=Fusarium albosuccineum TaxID=1237068 RepID=A0A8H4LPL9_9HYPO|nr:neutral amino acid permease [Fusarium albosuccineum]